MEENHPDAIITASTWASDIKQWLRMLGLRIPQDNGLALPAIPFREKRYSGVDENVRLIGAMAIDTVVGMIHRNERGVPRFPLRILAEGVWHAGTSIRGRSRRAMLATPA